MNSHISLYTQALGELSEAGSKKRTKFFCRKKEKDIYVLLQQRKHFQLLYVTNIAQLMHCTYHQYSAKQVGFLLGRFISVFFIK